MIYTRKCFIPENIQKYVCNSRNMQWDHGDEMLRWNSWKSVIPGICNGILEMRCCAGGPRNRVSACKEYPSLAAAGRTSVARKKYEFRREFVSMFRSAHLRFSMRRVSFIAQVFVSCIPCRFHSQGSRFKVQGVPGVPGSKCFRIKVFQVQGSRFNTSVPCRFHVCFMWFISRYRRGPFVPWPTVFQVPCSFPVQRAGAIR